MLGWASVYSSYLRASIWVLLPDSIAMIFVLTENIHYRNLWLCRVSGALGKAQFTLGKGFVECCTRQRSLGKEPVGKGVFAECLAECPTLGKVGTEKNPKKWEFLPKKWKKILISGGPHRPAPTHLRHFSRKIRVYAAGGIRTRDLPLRANLLYHCTTLSLMSGFRFSSQYIILNRV